MYKEGLQDALVGTHLQASCWRECQRNYEEEIEHKRGVAVFWLIKIVFARELTKEKGSHCLSDVVPGELAIL